MDRIIYYSKEHIRNKVTLADTNSIQARVSLTREAITSTFIPFWGHNFIGMVAHIKIQRRTKNIKRGAPYSFADNRIIPVCYLVIIFSISIQFYLHYHLDILYTLYYIIFVTT